MMHTFKINYWFLSSLFISCFVCIPLIVIGTSLFQDVSGYYQLLGETYVYTYIANTLLVLTGVLVLTFIFGVGAAYLTSFYQFPGSTFFTWALILSFAIPSYIYAYSLTAFFGYFGNLYSFLTYLFGPSDYHTLIPKVDGLLGSILSMSFSLFIYVYLITRASFIYQSQNLVDAGKIMGFSNYQTFKKIIFPSARPGIVVGLSLVAMESISDFGTVSFFNIQTLTTAIYDSWIIFDDIATAYQLSFFLIVIVLIFFWLERMSRSRSKFYMPTRGYEAINKIQLQGTSAAYATTFCLLLFTCSFLFPISQILLWVIQFPDNIHLAQLIELSVNTVSIVILTTLCLIVLAFFTNYGMRISKSKFLNAVTNFSVSGYVIPGVILAVTLLSFLSFVSKLANSNWIHFLFSGSIIGLVIAYCVRFYSLAINGIKSGYEKLNTNLDDASYLLGYTKFGTFIKIHLPFLQPNLLLIAMLVAIDILKELPITLILRPFNFETFATQAYTFASQDMLEHAAGPSLFLIIFSAIFILLSKKYILKGF